MATKKVIAKLEDHNFGNDCTEVGYSWVLYDDGSVVVTYHSRWQGTRDGVRYITGPGFIDVDEIDDDDIDQDAEALLTMATENVNPPDDSDFRCTSRGVIVR